MQWGWAGLRSDMGDLGLKLLRRVSIRVFIIVRITSICIASPQVQEKQVTPISMALSEPENRSIISPFLILIWKSHSFPKSSHFFPTMLTKSWVCFYCEVVCLDRFLCPARIEASQLAGVHWQIIYSAYHCILIPMFSHSEVPIALQIMADAWCSGPRVTLGKKRTTEIRDLHWMSWLYFVLFGKYQEWVSQGCLYFQQWFSYCRGKNPISSF